jgi:hypothetical protein
VKNRSAGRGTFKAIVLAGGSANVPPVSEIERGWGRSSIDSDMKTPFRGCELHKPGCVRLGERAVLYKDHITRV